MSTADDNEALPGYWPHLERDAAKRASAAGQKAPSSEAHSVPAAKAATKERARDLRSLLEKYGRRHLPPRPTREPPPPEPPRTAGRHARLLPALRLVPWALAALFAFSFAWDFDGLTLMLFGAALPLGGLLRVVSVSGLIGFLTNWLAVTMLFHPREARPLFGQGLLPAQRERVVFRMAQAISEDLINEEIIKRRIEESGLITRYRDLSLEVARGVLEDPAFRRELRVITADYAKNVLGTPAVQERIVRFTIERLEGQAERGLGGLALKAYRFLNEEDFRRRIDEAVQELPASVDLALDELDDLLDRVPAQIEARAGEIEAAATRAVLGFVENLDVYGLLMSRMADYDERQVEELIKKTSNEQLNYIKYLGGVLGVAGGLVIWNAPLALGLFVALGLVLYAADEALLRRRA